VPVAVLGTTPPSPLGVACAILSVGLIIALQALVMARFGLLTAAVFFVGNALVGMTPLTWDTSAWYFGQGLIGAAVVLALAVYGYVTATAGQRLFAQGFFGDDRPAEPPEGRSALGPDVQPPVEVAPVRP